MTVNPSVNSGNIYFIPHMIGAISGTIFIHAAVILKFYVQMHIVPVLLIEEAVFLSFILVTVLKRKSQSYIYFIEMIAFISFMLDIFIANFFF